MKYDKTNTLNDDSSVVQDIMRKVKIYATRYYKYAFPEEQFFREIAEKCIGDAFGADHTEPFTKAKIDELWNYVKRQALNYILNIEAELQKEFPNQGQISFYAFKLNCKVEDLQARVDSFKTQLMDRDDFVPR